MDTNQQLTTGARVLGQPTGRSPGRRSPGPTGS
jgi:hypothetical protein